MPRLRVNASALSSFLDCRQQAQFKDSGYELIQRKFAPRFGDVVHDALSHLYTSHQQLPHPFTSKANALEWVGESLPKFLREYVAANMTAQLSPQDCEDLLIAVQIAEVLVMEHFKFWDDLTGKGSWTILSSEGKFAVPYLGDFTLYGRKDLRVTVNKDQSRWVVDHKTMSQIRPSELLDLGTISLQNRFYILADYLQTGTFPAGLIYNIIRTPGLKPKKGRKTKAGPAKKENPIAFRNRIMEDIRSKAESYFFRFEVRFSPTDIKLWEQDLQAKLADYLRWNLGQVPTYKNDSGLICYGRYTCPFISACASGTITSNPLYKQTPHRPTRWEQLPKGKD